jgi:hypothetical protein
VSSLLRHAEPLALRAAGVVATARTSAVMDDFSHGLRDWYVLNAGNLTHQEMWTRKVTDPLYRAPVGARLKVSLKMPKTNRLTFVVRENDWRSYRGPRASYLCTREIAGSAEAQSVVLAAADFVSDKGAVLKDWAQVDELGICARVPSAAAKDAALWNGGAAEFVWVGWE